MLDRNSPCQSHSPSCSGRQYTIPLLWLSGLSKPGSRARHIIRAFLTHRETALGSKHLRSDSEALRCNSEQRTRRCKPTSASTRTVWLESRKFLAEHIRADSSLKERVPAALAKGIAALGILNAVSPGASTAAEALPVETLTQFLDTVESLGVFGPVVFVATIIGAEMVPLFPTQPLSIASGLLFGASKGSVLAFTGTTTAAILAFQLSRSVGRRLAERVIAEEITEEERKQGMFSRVQDAIDSGSFPQQLVAVTILRLTPVVPFSASNYLLGATPLKFSAYLGGSVLGISFWCILFASLGGASREVLRSGLSVDALLEDLMAKASGYTEDVALAALGLGIVALLFYKLGPQDEPHGNGKGDEQSDDREAEKV